MKIWVIDASVIVKWFLTDAENEEDISIALEILKALRNDNSLAYRGCRRHKPFTTDDAENVISLLYAMELPVCNNPVVFNVACRLAKTYHHHLFDTLYHAVALSQDNATLVTADLTYLNKVRHEGKIIPLSDFKLV